MNQLEIAKHKEKIVEMFNRKHPGARMVWLKPLKHDGKVVWGRFRAEGERYRTREMQAVIYLPKDWTQGFRYLIS